MGIEFDEADKLLKCQSKNEIDTLVNTWSDTFGESFKNSVWRTLNSNEKDTILRTTTPPKFEAGDWVRLISEEEESPEKIIESTYDSDLRIWIYRVDGKDIIYKEDEIKLDAELSFKDKDYETDL